MSLSIPGRETSNKGVWTNAVKVVMGQDEVLTGKEVPMQIRGFKKIKIPRKLLDICPCLGSNPEIQVSWSRVGPRKQKS